MHAGQEKNWQEKARKEGRKTGLKLQPRKPQLLKHCEKRKAEVKSERECLPNSVFRMGIGLLPGPVIPLDFLKHCLDIHKGL